MDLTKYLSGPLNDSRPRNETGCIIDQKKKPIFDLYGCVCHFGSIHGGHYTSYAKHLATGQVSFNVVLITNSHLDICHAMIGVFIYFTVLIVELLWRLYGNREENSGAWREHIWWLLLGIYFVLSTSRWVSNTEYWYESEMLHRW